MGGKFHSRRVTTPATMEDEPWADDRSFPPMCRSDEDHLGCCVHPRRMRRIWIRMWYYLGHWFVFALVVPIMLVVIKPINEVYYSTRTTILTHTIQETPGSVGTQALDASHRKWSRAPLVHTDIWMQRLTMGCNRPLNSSAFQRSQPFELQRRLSPNR